MRRALSRTSLWMCCLLALPATAWCAHVYRTDALRIDHPSARTTPPGAKTGAVYLTIDNAGDRTDRLLRASTPIAAGVVLHQMVQDGGVMRMRAVPSVEIIPGGRLELRPNGYHLMLIDLRQPLKAGDKFPLTLTFEHAGSVLVQVWVEDLSAPGERQ